MQNTLSAKFTKELDPIKGSNHGSFYLRTGAVGTQFNYPPHLTIHF